MGIIKNFRTKYLQRQELSQEALEAYFHRLPVSIHVTWFRDNGFIIGTISCDDKEIMTQGKDTDDFIDMVNDCIHTAYDIPPAYFSALKQVKNYQPPSEERKKLEDFSVKKSVLNLSKKQNFRLA